MSEVRKNVKPNKNNTCCSVHNCRSVGKKHPHLRFHIFPKAGESFVQIVNESGEFEKVDRLKAWEMATKIGKRVSRYMKVCSLHFKKDDYILPGKYIFRLCILFVLHHYFFYRVSCKENVFEKNGRAFAPPAYRP